jgi:anti-sigma factor RsiW
VRCEQIQDALALRGDPAHSLEPDVRAHLEECAACRAAALRQEGLDRLLAADADVEPRPGFDTRFFARLEAHKTRRRRLRGLLWVGVPALAAAAVALVTRPAPPPGDLELARNLDLVEDLDLLRRLDEVEAFAELRDVDLADLQAVGP